MTPTFTFPKTALKPLYKAIHHDWLSCMVSHLFGKDDVTFADLSVEAGPNFVFYYEDRPINIDYSDHHDVFQSRHYPTAPTFKFHCGLSLPGNVFPFYPVSFYDWEQYFQLCDTIKYGAAGIVTCRQRPYGNAVKRRQAVQKGFPRYATTLLPQVDYWREINKISSAVFVPGAREDMLDRGQFQYMAFGACTISPRINDNFPMPLIPDVHYICCDDSYNNLHEKIDWVKSNPNEAKDIGENAQRYFQDYCTPQALWQYLIYKLQ